MSKSKLQGLTWNKQTGQGKVDKRVPGVGRVQVRFRASSWQEAEEAFHRAVGNAKSAAAAPKTKTFVEAATKYLAEETKSSISRDAQGLEIIMPWIGHLKLDSVHQGTLQPYIDHRKSQGMKSNTVARELAVVRRILILASRVWRDLDDKPWLQTPPLIRLPKWDDEAKPYPLSWDEQRALLEAMPAHLAEMTLFGLNTGARENVICELRWEWEIKVPELNTSVFFVPREYAKNKCDGILVLNKTAKSIIESRRSQEGGHVFTYRGKPVARINNTGWRSAWKSAGLPVGDDVLSGPHNLRHTFARRLRAVGVPLETRKVLLHHVNGDITVHYSPAEIAELIEAVEKLSQSQRATILRMAV
jgi:integrase